MTSPPYDNLRDYEKTSLDGENTFGSLFEGIFRVLKDGGVCVWACR